MDMIRHLKKCIRTNIKEINKNKIKDNGDVEDLARWSGWVHNDCIRLLDEWKKKKTTRSETE